jgi:hypothetical protein
VCKETVRILRNTIPAGSIQSVTTTAKILITRSLERISLTITPPASGRLTLSLNPEPTDQNGITLYATQSPFKLSFFNDGALTFGPWYAIADAGTLTIGIAETFLPGLQDL